MRRKYIIYILYIAFAMCVFLLLPVIKKKGTRIRGNFLNNLDTRTPTQTFAKLNRKPATVTVIPTPEMEYSPEIVSSIFQNNFSCENLLNGVSTEMERAKSFLLSHKYTFKRRDDDDYRRITTDCENFKRSRGYILEPQSKMESDFPLAFNIIFHRNVEQLERLLRVLYRPQNQYCIHVDRKSPDNVKKAVEGIANCFDNVFIASKLEFVVYASYTRLLADINCMRDHIERNQEWNYLLNLASSELPLRTNLELVEIIKTFKGANDIRETINSVDKKRFQLKHFTEIDTRKKTGHTIHTKQKKEAPPNGLTITKGNAYNVFSRAFVEFTLNNDVAQALLDWSADTHTPDEHYWATLNNLYHNPFLKTPGGFSGYPDKKPYVARYIGWYSKRDNGRCIAKHYIHKICIFSVEDLPKLRTQSQLIANKFDIEYDPIAYSCMEEWLFNKTRDRVHFKKKILRKKNLV